MKNDLDLYKACKDILTASGDLVEDLKKKKFRVIRKSPKELVTEIDMAVQKHIAQALLAISDSPIFF